MEQKRKWPKNYNMQMIEGEEEAKAEAKEEVKEEEEIGGGW